MIKINDSNIYVGQIKQLLKDFNLPACNIYKEGTTLNSDLHYIKGNGIYYCDKDKNLIYKDSYFRGQFVNNLTSNMRITNNVYDSYTHKYLGNYLRFLKDFDGMDLMSMYNCFSGEFSSVIDTSFDVNNITRVFSVKDKRYMFYVIPVRFNENYTIAFNGNCDLEVFSSLYDNGNIIRGTEDDDDYFESMFISTYDRIRNCNFNRPYLYTKLKHFVPAFEEQNRQKSLVLIVKVPVGIESSLVVLEGDFRNGCKLDRTNGSILLGKLLRFRATHQLKEEGKTKGDYYIEDDTTWYGDYDYTSRLELLDFANYGGRAVLATRLIEYLTDNAITNISEGYDVKKAQSRLLSKKYIKSVYPGIWSNEEKNSTYAYINDNLINSEEFDVVSYFDKSVERKIGGIE